MKKIIIKSAALILVLLLCVPSLLSCSGLMSLITKEQTEESPSESAGTIHSQTSPGGEVKPPVDGGVVKPPVDSGEVSPSVSDDEPSPTIPVDPPVVDSKPVINERFDGQKIKFYVNGQGVQSRSIDIGDEDDPDHEVNVQVQKRNAQVEKELGVDIILAEVGAMQDTFATLQPLLASELYVYDVIALYQYFDLGLALRDTVGSFYNLLDMPEDTTSYLNPNASHWDKTLFETTAYKGVAFFITGDLSLSYTGTMFVSYVNATMWEEFADQIEALETSGGYGDIYDIVNNGYWTLDLWSDLAKMAYKDDGDNEKDYEDRCGFMTYNQQLNNIMVDMLAAGSNVHYGGTTKDGDPTIEIYTDKNIAFYQKLYTLLCESDTVTIPWLYGTENENDLYILNIFAEGQVLLNVNTLHQAEEYLSDMDDDFYVMPLPMFDRNQFDANKASKGYTTQVGDSVSQYAICTAIGNDKVPAVTATLELMAYYSKQWVTPVYYETVLGEQYTHNPRNAEMIDMIKKGIYTDFVFIWSHSLGDVTWLLRQHYSEGAKIDSNLKGWDRNATSLLKTKLLGLLEPEEPHF